MKRAVKQGLLETDAIFWSGKVRYFYLLGFAERGGGGGRRAFVLRGVWNIIHVVCLCVCVCVSRINNLCCQ